MKSGHTRAEWTAGSLPVPPYQARHVGFTQYTVIDASPTDATLSLMLQPLHPKTTGAIAYQVHVVNQRGRWLVDWFLPVAFYSPADHQSKITAEPDLAPHASGDGFGLPSSRQITAAWVIVGIMGIFALGLVGTGVLLVVRGRRRHGVTSTAGDQRWAEAIARHREESAKDL